MGKRKRQRSAKSGSRDADLGLRDFLQLLVDIDALSAARADAIAELLQESDRGCVLIATAMLDGQLESLLRKKFIELTGDSTAGIQKLLFHGVLESLHTKHNLAYVLGLIDKTTLASISAIREIRNDFAHEWPYPAALNEAHVDKIANTFPVELRQVFRQICDAIVSLPTVVEITSPARAKFLLTALVVSNDLSADIVIDLEKLTSAKTKKSLKRLLRQAIKSQGRL